MLFLWRLKNSTKITDNLRILQNALCMVCAQHNITLLIANEMVMRHNHLISNIAQSFYPKPVEMIMINELVNEVVEVMYAVKMPVTGWVLDSIVCVHHLFDKLVWKKHPKLLDYRLIFWSPHNEGCASPNQFERDKIFKMLLQNGWHYDDASDKWVPPERETMANRVVNIIYAVRMPDTGWEPDIMVATRYSFEEQARQKHPQALEHRYVGWMSICQGIIVSSNDSRSMYGIYEKYWPCKRLTYEMYDTFWACHWFYDNDRKNWLSPGEVGEKPDVKPVLATFEMKSCLHAGWWKWHMFFTPATQGDTTTGKGDFQPKNIKYDIWCSNVFEPITGLQKFLEELKTGHDVRFTVDEEGTLAYIFVWHLPEGNIQVRLESKGYKENYCHDLILKKENFLAEIDREYERFVAQGGLDEFLPSDDDEEDIDDEKDDDTI